MENRCGFNPVDSNVDRYAKTLQLQSFFSRLILIFSLLFLTSCGSSGSGSGAEMITGQFIDDPVAGLVYHCSSGEISETTAD